MNPEDPVPELGPYEIAYLHGGRPRVLATAMVRLKDLGHADVTTDGQVVICSVPVGSERVEREVFDELAKQSGNTLDPKPLVKAVKELEETRFVGLREEGLTLSPRSRFLGGCLPAVLCLGAIFLFGITRMGLGIVNDKPVGFLIASMVATFVVTAIAFGRPLNRTRKADAMLANLSQRHGRLRTLRSDLEPGDAGLAVALFGVAVLSGTAYASMYDRMRKFDSTGAGGGCGSTGCSAAGCGGGGGGSGGCGGGGGCGGCGGGGGD